MFANHVRNKWPVFGIYKEHLQLKNETNIHLKLRIFTQLKNIYIYFKRTIIRQTTKAKYRQKFD